MPGSVLGTGCTGYIQISYSLRENLVEKYNRNAGKAPVLSADRGMGRMLWEHSAKRGGRREGSTEEVDMS